MHPAAKQLLNNNALQTVLTELENEYISQLVATEPGENALRENLYLKINAGKELLQWVKNYGHES